MNQSTEKALFALGSFWEPEYRFSKLKGVIHTKSGYAGGTSTQPTYHAIGDHAESVEIEFDPRVISYEQLLVDFWHWHDPTAEYESRFRSIIFYFDEAQHNKANESKATEQRRFKAPIVTKIVPAHHFYPAEPFNQNYLARLRGEI